MKIKGLINDYDYGFGKDENFFGCYCEAYILSIDSQRTLKPTIGDIDYNNFLLYKKFCQENNIEVGDFKSLDKKIPDDSILQIIKNRKAYIETNVFL